MITIAEGTQIVISVAALGGLVINVLNRMDIRTVSKGVQVVHKATNSMKDELVALTAKSSKAEGVKEGREAQKSEDGAKK